jgi:hypothetical protein
VTSQRTHPEDAKEAVAPSVSVLARQGSLVAILRDPARAGDIELKTFSAPPPFRESVVVDNLSGVDVTVQLRPVRRAASMFPLGKGEALFFSPPRPPRLFVVTVTPVGVGRPSGGG